MGNASGSFNSSKPGKTADRRSSWQARDGWIAPVEKPKTPEVEVKPIVPGREYAQDGPKIKLEDTATHRQLPGNNAIVKEKETRSIGHGMLGVADSQAVWDKIESLKPGEMFIDDQFPSDRRALYYSKRKPIPGVVWKSPKELSSNPQMIVDGTTKGDVLQGDLADCWFLSSAAVVSQKSSLMKKIIPEGQILTGDKYKGAVHFRFWRFGQWVDVYIDDKLPTKDGKLLYGHCADPNEFWVPLLEKAYAKLHGSYEATEGGQAMDALVDLTGGIAERYELGEPHKHLFNKIQKAVNTGALITCSKKFSTQLKGKWSSHSAEIDENGLVGGHCYSVTDAKRIARKTGAECLLRIRNPWGIGQEWTGSWSDDDNRWNLIDKETKAWLNYVKKDDGEFWMGYKDFCKCFQEVTICTIGPDFNADGQQDNYGMSVTLHGQWDMEKSAGGSRNDIYSFAKNPQFILTVLSPDAVPVNRVKKLEKPYTTCSVLICLMQDHRRSERHVKVQMMQIGFLIYKTSDTHKRLTTDFLMTTKEFEKYGEFVNFREVVGRFELEPGNYVIIPATFNKNEEGKFLLRIFAAKTVEAKELPDYDPNTDVMTRLQNGSEELIPPRVVDAKLPQYTLPNSTGNEYEIDLLLNESSKKK